MIPFDLDAPSPWLVPILGTGEALYRASIAARRALYESGALRRFRVERPVISVGNLTVGGNGKTPLVIWLVDRLASRGLHVAVVSRGYGAPSPPPGAAIVSRRGELELSAAEAGDEPVLIARRTSASVVVARRRIDGAKKAVSELGADVILLDDGFQHLALIRDLDLVLLDASAPFGNGHLLPRGTLREPASAIDRAHVRIVHCGNADAPKVPTTTADLTIGVRPTRLTRGGVPSATSALRGARIGVVAGIARPLRFIETLEHLGATVVHRTWFGDHAPIGPVALAALGKEAMRLGATLVVTTEKDAVRIGPDHDAGPLPLWALGVDVVPLGRTERLDAAIDAVLSGGAPFLR